MHLDLGLEPESRNESGLHQRDGVWVPVPRDWVKQGGGSVGWRGVAWGYCMGAWWVRFTAVRKSFKRPAVILVCFVSQQSGFLASFC
jgi:hypothetical protein